MAEITVNDPGVSETVTLDTPTIDTGLQLGGSGGSLGKSGRSSRLPKPPKLRPKSSHSHRSSRSHHSKSKSNPVRESAEDAGEDLKPADFDLLMNPSKCKTAAEETKQADLKYIAAKAKASRSVHSDSESDSESESDSGSGSDSDSATASESDSGSESESEVESAPKKSSSGSSRQAPSDPLEAEKAIAFEKAKILFKLKRREQFMGIKIKYDTSMSLEELRTIEMQYKHEADATSTVTMMRQVIIYVAGITEAMSKTMKWTGLDLQGFSTHMFLKVKQYDEALFDVYDEYADAMRVSPIWRLVYLYVMDTLSYSSSMAILRNPEAMRAINANPMLKEMLGGSIPTGPMPTGPMPTGSMAAGPMPTGPAAATPTVRFAPAPRAAPVGTDDDDPDPEAEAQNLLRMMESGSSASAAAADSPKTEEPIEVSVPSPRGSAQPRRGGASRSRGSGRGKIVSINKL